MPLSEYEQRVLEQLERELGADPKLGRTMSAGPRRAGRLIVGLVGVVGGLAVMIAGVMTSIIPLGIAGFAVMLVAAMWVILAPQPKGPRPVGGSAKPRSKSKPSAKRPFLERVEDRLQERRDQGQL